MTDQQMPEAVAEGKISRIEGRRALGEAQSDLEDIVGKPAQPAPRGTASRADKQRKEIAGGINADRLLSIIQRVERLEEERKALAGDIKDIWSEAKSAGFDVPVCKQIIKLRAQDPNEVEEQMSLLDTYKRALGMGV